ncbi:hypothetical protein ACFL3V_02035 [Nanoarchaeota archaeon]
MDSYTRSEYVRKRLGKKKFIRKAARYLLATGALVALAYGADRCDASKTIDNYVSKAKSGIERVIDKI